MDTQPPDGTQVHRNRHGRWKTVHPDAKLADGRQQIDTARIKELDAKMVALVGAGHTATGRERRVLNRYKTEAAHQIDVARRED